MNSDSRVVWIEYTKLVSISMHRSLIHQSFDKFIFVHNMCCAVCTCTHTPSLPLFLHTQRTQKHRRQILHIWFTQSTFKYIFIACLLVCIRFISSKILHYTFTSIEISHCESQFNEMNFLAFSVSVWSITLKRSEEKKSEEHREHISRGMESKINLQSPNIHTRTSHTAKHKSVWAVAMQEVVAFARELWLVLETVNVRNNKRM